MNWKRTTIEMLLLLAAAVCIGVIVNMGRAEAHKLAWFRTEPRVARSTDARLPAPAPSAPGDPGALYTKVTAEVAFRMHDAGALFIDARRTDAFEAGHIAGARSIPVWEHDADTRIEAMVLQGVPFDRELVVYCSGLTCEDSARLAEKLALAGFYRISLYEEGYPDWVKRSWPVSRGAKP